jgi:UDP-N-acetylglucosamine:LPS N-acetylglucosamine transferase
MPALDFAISATGRNTFNELLACGIPAIFIPKVRGYDDQYRRAK